VLGPASGAVVFRVPREFDLLHPLGSLRKLLLTGCAVQETGPAESGTRRRPFRCAAAI